MNTQYPKRKRIFLINRDFQLRYTRSAVVVGLISTTLTMFLILYPLYYFRIIRSLTFLPDPFLVAIVVAAVFNFLVVAMMGILVTHRIAGPMYALVKSMRQIQIGRFNASLNVRKDDEMKFVVRNFNDMVESLTALSQSDFKHLEAIEKELEDPAFDKERAAKIAEQVGQLKSTIEARYRGDLPIK